MLHVDLHYANLVGVRLDRFKVLRHDPFVAKFRCHLCGDSQKSKYKARGHLYVEGDGVRFHCFNCGRHRELWEILKSVDQDLLKEYNLENFKEKAGYIKTHKTREHVPVQRSEIFSNYLDFLPKVSELPPGHPTRVYVEGRKIPYDQHERLYHCEKFVQFTNSLIPDKMRERDEGPRLLIPFLDEDGDMFGYQGRALFETTGPDRYRTVMIDESQDKVFGLDRCDLSKKHFVTEGPIDSLFLPNAIAMAGSDLKRVRKDTAVLVWDNEPRNREICRKLATAAERGYSVVVWPDQIKEKDVNDMILAGMKRERLLSILDECTYRGPMAVLKLSSWRKDR